MNHINKFIDRHQAGNILATQLKAYANRPDIIILGLPRGGVPVAYEVARALNAPLDVFMVRKLGVPGHDELAMGAIATGGTCIFNHAIIRELAIDKTSINLVIEQEQAELQRREALYRGNMPRLTLANKTVILVDDGIATGATVRAALKALKQFKPAHLILAVPVAAKQTCDELKSLVDNITCPMQLLDLQAVGTWYEDFSQTSDSEVIALLTQ